MERTTGAEPFESRELWSRPLARRGVLRLLACGVGGAAASSLLAACGAAPTAQPPAPAAPSPAAPAAAPSPAAAPVPAASPAAAPAAAGLVKKGGNLTLGITDISSLNPFVSNSVVDSLILALLYPTLATLDKQSNRTPYVAEKWETSPDGLTNTVRLRKGFTWEDGKPLTSQDVKFTVDWETKYKFSFKAGIADFAESIDTPDDYTIVFKMKKPVGTFNYDILWWFRIMPKHVWETIEDPKTFANEKPVGAGAFRLSRWEKTQFVELEARQDYSFPPVGHPPNVDKLIFRIYPEPNTLTLAFQNGDVDVVPIALPVDSAATLQASQDLEVIVNPSTGYNFIAPNIAKNPHLADLKVRQALASALDKDSIVKIVFKGFAGKMTTVVSPVLGGWYDASVKDWPFDVEAGKKLLDEAGYVDTNGNGIRNAPAARGGQDLRLRLSYSSTDAVSQKVAQIVKENWDKLGIQVALDAQEGNALYQRVRFDYDFDLYVSGWGIVDNPPRHYYSSFHPSQYSSGSNNYIGFEDKEFDNQILQVLYEPDTEKARQGCNKIQQLEHNLVPIFPIYYPQLILAYNKKKWAGFEVLPGVLLGIASWQSMTNVHQAT